VFEKALAAFRGGDQVDVVFRPYQLQPDAPVNATSLSGWLAKKFGSNVDRMLSRVSARSPRIAWRGRPGVSMGARVQRALVEALFHAHFSDDGDVGDHGR